MCRLACGMFRELVYCSYDKKESARSEGDLAQNARRVGSIVECVGCLCTVLMIQQKKRSLPTGARLFYTIVTQQPYSEPKTGQTALENGFSLATTPYPP